MLLRNPIGFLNVEEWLNTVSNKVLWVKNVIETFGCLEALLCDEILFVIDADKNTQWASHQEKVIDFKA